MQLDVWISGTARSDALRSVTSLLAPLRASCSSRLAPFREVERSKQPQKRKRLSTGELFRFDHFAHARTPHADLVRCSDARISKGLVLFYKNRQRQRGK